MKNIKIVSLIGLLCLLLVGCNQSTSTLGGVVINYPSIDLNADGKLDEVKLVNEAVEGYGEISLVINDERYELDTMMPPPDSKMYRMTLDYITINEQVLLFTRVSQFTNGTGSTEISQLFKYNNGDLTKLWDDSEIELMLTHTLKSDVLTLRLNEEDFEVVLDNYENISPWLTSVVSSSLISRFGEYYIESNRAVRGMSEWRTVTQTYLVTEEGLMYESSEVK